MQEKDKGITVLMAACLSQGEGNLNLYEGNLTGLHDIIWVLTSAAVNTNPDKAISEHLLSSSFASVLLKRNFCSLTELYTVMLTFNNGSVVKHKTVVSWLQKLYEDVKHQFGGAGEEEEEWRHMD